MQCKLWKFTEAEFMEAHLVLYLTIGAVMAVTVGSLAIYRRRLARTEFDTLHISDTGGDLIPGQEQLAHRIEVIDRWGMSLTIVLVVYALAIGSVYLYQVWQATSTNLSQ